LSEFPFDSLQSLLGEHFFFLRFLLLRKAGDALSLVGKVALAFEAAGSEAGKGVECAQEVERVELDGLAEGVSADFSDGIADLGGGNFMGGLEDIDALLLAGEVEGEFVAEAGVVQEAQFTEIILIAGLFPAADGVLADIGSVLGEVPADSGVGNAIVEHLIDLVASGFWETGDIAAEVARRAKGWWQVG